MCTGSQQNGILPVLQVKGSLKTSARLVISRAVVQVSPGISWKVPLHPLPKLASSEPPAFALSPPPGLTAPSPTGWLSGDGHSTHTAPGLLSKAALPHARDFCTSHHPDTLLWTWSRLTAPLYKGASSTGHRIPHGAWTAPTTRGSSIAQALDTSPLLMVSVCL